MASRIETFLNRIATAIYGSEVRDSIHDSIKECYDNVTAGKTLADAAAINANNAASAANTAAIKANNAASAANTAKENADATVDALPNTVATMFASLGIVVVDHKLCIGVEKE